MSRANPDVPLSPACMKCEQVTGKSTCFPAPCVFWHERDTPGTKAFNIAELDRVRRGMRETVRASTPDAGEVCEKVARAKASLLHLEMFAEGDDIKRVRDAIAAIALLAPSPTFADAGEVRTYREGIEREAKAIWMALEGRFLADEWQDAVWAGTSKSTILNLPEEDILAEDGSVYDSPVQKFGRASYMAAAAAIRKLP